MSNELARREGTALIDRLTDELLVLKARMASDIYELGVVLARIRDEELWRFRDAPTFEAYCEDHAGIGRTSAYRAIDVATHFNGEIAARYGPDKLYAVLRWMAATPRDERPGDVFAARIRLRDERGRFYQLPLHEATGAQIRAAVELLQQARAGGRGVPRAWSDRAARVNAMLGGTSRSPRARVVRDRKGRMVASFRNVPVEDLRELIRGIEEHLVDVDDEDNG